ncbi:hypothetical protein [Pedobacter sp. KLB.chiD]|uniref:hypothetical protein n=1 Tax=Pedobacter sp. KLB.chiD TaxID=3387402 RepID=UPI00399A3283
MYLHFNEEIISLSREILTRSINEATYFPIDRAFLEQFINQIVSVNNIDFILYNIELINPTYTKALFLCLPELWTNFSEDDFDYLLKKFSNSISYFLLIEFSYKYIEVNILELILKYAKINGFYNDVKEYLKNQYSTIIKSMDERMDLEIGVEREAFGYNAELWNYIKQRLLIGGDIKEAIQDILYLENYLSKLLTIS